MFHVFWRLTWTMRIWRHPQLHYLQTSRQEGGTHFKLQTSRKDILNLPVLQKEARGRGASGCTHLPSMEQQVGCFSTPFQMIKTLIAQIEDQQSLAMNIALNNHALDGRTNYFSKINHVNSTRIVVGHSSQNFQKPSPAARPMEYHELVAGTPRITREQAGPYGRP